VSQLRALLKAREFKDVPRPDTRECNFVMGDEQGRLIDIHTYTFDPLGHPEYGIDYPLESLNGVRSILGHPVRCITLAGMVKFHLSYMLDKNDYHDVNTLCERFGIELPEEYDAFEK
jgi:lincosamide nucleotidyltransferase A/C/D/E